MDSKTAVISAIAFLLAMFGSVLIFSDSVWLQLPNLPEQQKEDYIFLNIGNYIVNNDSTIIQNVFIASNRLIAIDTVACNYLLTYTQNAINTALRDVYNSSVTITLFTDKKFTFETKITLRFFGDIEITKPFSYYLNTTQRYYVFDLTKSVFLPFTLLATSNIPTTIISTVFPNTTITEPIETEKTKTKANPNYKLASASTVSDTPFSEQFDILNEGIWIEDTTAGDNSSWTTTVANSLYTFMKDESGYNETADTTPGGIRFNVKSTNAYDYFYDVEGANNDLTAYKYFPAGTHSLSEPARAYFATSIDKGIPEDWSEGRGSIAFTLAGLDDYWENRVLTDAFLNVYKYDLPLGYEQVHVLSVYQTSEYLEYAYGATPIYNCDGCDFVDTVIFDENSAQYTQYNITLDEDWLDFYLYHGGYQFSYQIRMEVTPDYSTYQAKFYDQTGSGTYQPIVNLFWRDANLMEFRDPTTNGTIFNQGDEEMLVHVTPYTYYGFTNGTYNVTINDITVEYNQTFTGGYAVETDIVTYLEDIFDFTAGTYYVTYYFILDNGTVIPYTIYIILAYPNYDDDLSYASLSTNLEVEDNIVLSMDFLYIQKATKAVGRLYFPNRFKFQLGIGDIRATPIAITDFVGFDLYDNTDGDVYVQWTTATGTVSYDTTVNLADGYKYKFVIDYRRLTGDIYFSILNGTGHQLLRATNWLKYVTDANTNRPTMLYTDTVQNSAYSAIYHSRQGYIANVNMSSTVVPTGESSFAIDLIYASVPYIDNNFELTSATNSNATSFIIESNYLGATYIHSRNSYQVESLTYKNYINDFRYATAKMGYMETVRNTSDVTGLTIGVNFYIAPVFYNGTEDTTNVMWIALRNQAGDVRLILQDNSTFTRSYYTVSLTTDPIKLDAGVGFFWEQEKNGEKILAAAVNVFNQKATELETHTVYLNLNSSLYSNDIIFSTNFGFTGQADDESAQATTRITDFDIQAGVGDKFNIANIPIPDQPWVKIIRRKTLFDSVLDPFANVGSAIWGGVTGFPQQLVDGILDLPDLLITGFSDIIANIQTWLNTVGTFIVDGIGEAIGGIFDLIIPFFLATWGGIFEWFLDFFNLRDVWTESVGIFTFFNSLITLLWLLSVFLCISAPLMNAALKMNGDTIFADYLKIWLYDITFGLSIFGIRIPVPFIAMVVILTAFLGPANGITWLGPLFPW